MNLKGVIIGVLEYEHCSGRKHWTIRNLEREWRKSGAQIVRYAKLSERPPEVDVWFCHLNSTKMPSAYKKFINEKKHVINRDLVDISKTYFSDQLISDSLSSYSGEVIVKSDYNYGGVVDELLVNRHHGLSRYLPKKLRNRTLGLPGDFKPFNNYEVYDAIRDVPQECFDRPDVIVEKFLPERVEGNYAIRMLFKLGGRAVTFRILSRDKVVKNRNLVSVEQIETDARVIDWANRHNVNYGKVDYAVHKNELVFFDINRTPGISGASEENQRIVAESLAQGLLDYLPQ